MLDTIITADTETRVINSATEKVLRLPLEAVVLIGDPRKVNLATVLHRTGADGWLSTRRGRFPATTPGRFYLTNQQVRDALEVAELHGTEFILLYPGREA